MPWCQCSKEVEQPTNPLPFSPSKECCHEVLFSVKAQFLGRKAPSASFDGFESIQKPLTELYFPDCCEQPMAKDIPREVIIFVLNSGLFALSANPIDAPIWIRIQKLRGCGSVKAVNTSSGLQFLTLDSSMTSSSNPPAIFAVISERDSCMPLLDCHAFFCPDDSSAFQLTSYLSAAYEDRSGWCENAKPPPINFFNMQETIFPCHSEKEPTNPCDPQLLEKPHLQGFFYAPSSNVIKSYDLGVQPELVVCPPEEPCPPAPLIIVPPAKPPPVIEFVNQPQNMQPQFYRQQPPQIGYEQFMNSPAFELEPQNIAYPTPQILNPPSEFYQSQPIIQPQTYEATNGVGGVRRVDVEEWMRT